jgi:oxygen-dependent protoporphyrinogen oxidase
MERVETIIIGAGIAGLTAAWYLQRLGREVLILEAAEQVGGRMATHRQNGFLIDSGAQFLSTGFGRISALCAACNLNIEPLACSHSAIASRRRMRRIRSDNMSSMLRSGLLGPWDWFRFGMMHWCHRDALRRRDLVNLSQWADVDDESAHDWALREAGVQALEHVIEPVLEGLYFQQPETTSKAFVLMANGFAWRHHSIATLRGGMGALPLALAARLQVRCSDAVLGLYEEGDSVRVHATRGSYLARYIVCALPAPGAYQIWHNAPQRERDLMATPYSATINVALMLRPGYLLPRTLRRIYGVLVPRGERQMIAALAIEGNKCRDRAVAGSLINVMLCDAVASKLMRHSDDELFALLGPELDRLLPGARQALVAFACYRWPKAMPRSPIGRATDLARYRAPSTATRRILLAGDYMGAPFTEGAAETGIWAAERICAENPE